MPTYLYAFYAYISIPKFHEIGGPRISSATLRVVTNLDILHRVGYFSPSKNTDISLNGFKSWHYIRKTHNHPT